METNVNIPLLRKAVEWAEAEAAKPAADRQWFQADWVSAEVWDDEAQEYVGTSCGTAYCIAGYVGMTLDEGYAGEYLHPETDVPVSTFARGALGLTHDQAESLFAASNKIAAVRRIAESLAGERL